MITRRLFTTAAAVAALLAPALLAAPAQAETIGVALASDTNPFYVAMRKGIEARVAELGWEARFVTANESVAAQVQGVEDLVAQGVDGILISPIDAVASGPAYAAAGAAGIPIMSIARQAQAAEQTASIAMDEVGIGAAIGAWLADRIGGQGKIAMVAGPSGAETFRNLAQGFAAEIAKHPGIEVVFKKEVGLSREEGLRVAEDLLVAHPDVVAIYGGNDEVALGAVQAVAAAGRTGEIIVTGLNGVPPAKAAVAAGELGMTVELNPVVWGTLGVDTMARWLAGDHGFDRVNVGYQIIDRK